MKFVFSATIFIVLVNGANALWCCCALDKNSEACCKSVMGSGTFFAPSCGLVNGQTCDVGGSPSKLDDYKYCCNYREGSGSGTCW
ncbi:hypothetical protein BDV93DRAFT_255146 [Ceratobasidium sp. AG-I]|nr:hypothetical protein BDV93DRAFT_255146 [Ceratobasidium sp. AG-I]